MHVGGLLVFQPPDQPESDQLRGEPDGRSAVFDYERFVELIEQRIALVPRYRQKIRCGPGSPGQPGLGGRHRVRHLVPCPPLGATQARLGRSSCGSCGPACSPARSTATGRCGRCISSRDSATTGSRSSPRPTTRWSTASARSISAQVILDAVRSSRGRCPTISGCPSPSPARLSLVAMPSADLVRRPSARSTRSGLALTTSEPRPARCSGVVGGLASAARRRFAPLLTRR